MNGGTLLGVRTHSQFTAQALLPTIVFISNLVDTKRQFMLLVCILCV